MDNELPNKIIEEINQKHELAEILFSLFLASIDILLYLVIICLFGCNFTEKCISIRIKISLLIILDICFRIINLYLTSFTYSLNTEIIFTSFSTIQFLLILIILNKIFQDKNISVSDRGEIKFPVLTSILFFILSFKLKDFLLCSLIQYILAIFSILVYTYYIKGNINKFLSSVEKKNSNFETKIFIYNLPLFIMLYFVIHSFLKIIVFLVENLLYISYIEMASDLFKEVGKYLCFGMLIAIYYLYNKYIKEEDYDTDTDSNHGSVNISNISSISSS